MHTQARAATPSTLVYAPLFACFVQANKSMLLTGMMTLSMMGLNRSHGFENRLSGRCRSGATCQLSRNGTDKQDIQLS